MKKTRDRKETEIASRSAIEFFGHILLSPLPRVKTDIVQLRCLKGHEFETPAAYLIIAYKKKSKSGGCVQCRDLLHSLKGKDNFEKRIKELGYTLLGEYKSARSKVMVKNSAGEINYICSQDLDAGRIWPALASKKKTDIELDNYLDARKSGYKILKVLNPEASIHKKRVLARCPNGHEYEVKWLTLKEYNCGYCVLNQASQAEKDVAKILKNTYLIQENVSLKTGLNNRYEVDILLSDFQIGIEYCGLFYHSTVFREPDCHKSKREYCLTKGIDLITIFEDEWANKKETILNRISTLTRIKQSTSLKDLTYFKIPWEKGLASWHKLGFLKPMPSDTLLGDGKNNFLLVRQNSIIDWAGELPRKLPSGLTFVQDLNWVPDWLMVKWDLKKEKDLPLLEYLVHSNYKFLIPDGKHMEFKLFCEKENISFDTLKDCGRALWIPATNT
jgi:hypothetical protein